MITTSDVILWCAQNYDAVALNPFCVRVYETWQFVQFLQNFGVLLLAMIFAFIAGIFAWKALTEGDQDGDE